MSRIGFILYDNRSGSTLLSAELSRRAGICVSQESDLLFHLLEQAPEQLQAEELNKLGAVLMQTRFPELQLDWGAVTGPLLAAAGGCLARSDLAASLLKAYFSVRAPQAEVWLYKGPRLHFHLATLQAWFPDAPFVQIIRDGRAVYCSKYQSISGTNGKPMDRNLLHAAHSWQRKLALAECLGQACCNIRYEDLVAEGDKALMPVLSFLGLSEAARECTAAAADFAPANIDPARAHLHSNVGAGMQLGRIDGWREWLPSVDQLLYEQLNGQALRRYGYVLDAPRNLGLRAGAILRYRQWQAGALRDRVVNAARLLRKGGLLHKLRTKRMERGGDAS